MTSSTEDADGAPSGWIFGTCSSSRWLARRWSELRTQTSWREASGAVGDLGTFLPILVGLTVRCDLDVGTTLVFTGMYNLATACVFDVPMPLQPMKTIAAVALSDENGGFTMPIVVAAGIFVSVVVLTLGATGMMDKFNAVTPRGVIKGMQLGLGMSLCAKGYDLAVYTTIEGGGDKEVRPMLGVDGLLVGVVALVFALGAALPAPHARAASDETDETLSGSYGSSGNARDADGGDGEETLAPMEAGAMPMPRGEDAENNGTARLGTVDDGGICRPSDHRGISPSTSRMDGDGCHERTPPVALALVFLGVLFALCRPGSVASLRLGPSVPALLTLTPRDFARGVVEAGVAQLPLTTLNSVIAVCALSTDLFPDRPRVEPRTVAVSVGAMNLVGCAFGVMPCCHGAGGLAAHYHFGARSAAAVALLGFGKLALGLAFGSSLLTLLRRFPPPVLGVMLAAASVELMRAGLRGLGGTAASASTGRTSGKRAGGVVGESLPGEEIHIHADAGGSSEVYILIVTAAATVASKNTGMGCAFGVAAAALAAGRARWVSLRETTGASARYNELR